MQVCKDQGFTRQDPNLGTRTPAPSNLPCGKGRPSCINHQTHTSPHLGKSESLTIGRGNATTRTGAQQISESLYKTQIAACFLFFLIMSSTKDKSEPPNDDAMAGNDDKPRLTEEEKKQNHIASGKFFYPLSFLLALFPWMSLSHIFCRTKAKAGDS